MKTSASRILVIPSWYPPDGGHFFQDHAEALHEQGFEVDVLVNRVVGITMLRWKHRYTYRTFSLQMLNGTRLIRSWFLKAPYMELWNMKRWTRSSLRLYRRYEKYFGRPDLILAHSSIWAGYASALISEKTDLPYILVEHRGRFTPENPKADVFLKAAFEPFLRKAFGGADRIVTVSDALHTTIRTYLPEEDEGKLLTIPNMVDTDLFSPAEVKNRDGMQIISVGRLGWEKGYDLLIGAFSRLGQDFPRAELKIIGEGPERQKLEELVRQLGLGDKVHFPGYMSASRIVKELLESSLFALASRYESFGVVFIEAMATGLPLLASRAGGPQTFIPDFAGEMVDVENKEALYLALRKMLSDPGKYDRERIRNHTLEHFSREAVSAKYAELIEAILHD